MPKFALALIALGIVAIIAGIIVLFYPNTLKNHTDASRNGPLTIHIGEKATINLEENPSTGYAWHWHCDTPNLVKLVSDNYTQQGEATGAGGIRTLQFEGLQVGKALITLKYYRAWEGEDSTTPENIQTRTVEIIE